MLRNFELQAYKDWIDANVSEAEAMGNCSVWVLVMKSVFPELTVVAGSVAHKYSTDAYHEYLKTPCGVIVDPTASQFDFMFGNKWQYLEESAPLLTELTLYRRTSL